MCAGGAVMPVKLRCGLSVDAGVANTVQQVEAKWKTVVEAIGSVRAGLVGLLRDMGLEHSRDEDLEQLERLLILGESGCAENVMHQYLTSTLGDYLRPGDHQSTERFLRLAAACIRGPASRSCLGATCRRRQPQAHSQGCRCRPWPDREQRLDGAASPHPVPGGVDGLPAQPAALRRLLSAPGASGAITSLCEANPVLNLLQSD